jgi:hypothetical protein
MLSEYENYTCCDLNYFICVLCMKNISKNIIERFGLSVNCSTDFNGV